MQATGVLPLRHSAPWVIRRYPRPLARVLISVIVPLHQIRVNQGELDGEGFALLPACTLMLDNRVTVPCKANKTRRKKAKGCGLR